MEFLAREQEVRKLTASLNQPDYELILVYGRRHIGNYVKTKIM